MSAATLTLASKNYSSWSLRGWLLCRMAGLEFEEIPVSADDPEARAELLLLTPSVRVPRLTHGDISVWDTLAIAEYLAEIRPEAGLLPEEIGDRAVCRAIAGEIHSGFQNLRSALPMNIKAHFPGFKVFAGAEPDIARIREIWRERLLASSGPFLFGSATLADAMFAPVASRFTTYDVPLEPICAEYCEHIMGWAPMREWVAAAQEEPEEIEELEVEF